MDRPTALATPMKDAASSVIRLWDGVIERAEQLDGDDWLRPTPERDMDVRALVVHLTTTLSPAAARGATTILLEQLRATRDAQAVRLSRLAEEADEARQAGAQTTRGQRLLRASCLDMFVHAHDLSVALGHEPHLDDSAAATEACRYLMPMVGHLLTGDVGLAPASSVRLDVAGLEPPSAQPGTDVVTATPAALVLLLSGRGDADEWRERGALSWSGPTADAFVRRARLFS
jgi:hypothetical protein